MTFSTTFTAQYHDTVTEPIYLIELGFNPVLRISSSQDIVWDGYYWMAAPIEVSSIDNDAVGGQSVSLTLNNHDRTFGALVLSQVAKDRGVRIWSAYDDALTTAPVLFSDGVMDGAEVGERVRINVISKSTAYGSTPRILCGPPLMNHLPPSGTVLKAGKVTITIRSR